MPAMAKNIQLHLATGVLLILGYVIAIVADGVDGRPAVVLDLSTEFISAVPIIPARDIEAEHGLVPGSPRLHDLPH